MLKKMLLFFLLTFLLEASDKIKVYTIEVDVKSNKVNGKDWDVAGGAPDIKIDIDGKSFPMESHCRNRYRCSMTFVTDKVNNEWYFEIYDQDFSSNDLIGKGNCSASNSCNLGRAKITIKEK